MNLSPEQCGYRQVLPGGDGLAVCGLVRGMTGIDDAKLSTVAYPTCQACCRALAPANALNPVVASLIHNASVEVIRRGGDPACTVARARELEARVASHLAVVLSELPDVSFPPEGPAVLAGGNQPATAADGGRGGRRWMVGLLTAPRPVPTIGRSMASLRRAGFDRVHVFAEPGSLIPEEAAPWPVALHPRRLGIFANFYSSLATLYRLDPHAGCYCIFQDDVLAAEGLKSWCDGQLWPLGQAVVSLFTSSAHAALERGWRVVRPGLLRTHGGQAFLFRPDALCRFLADPMVLNELRMRRYNDDSMVGSWATRHETGIAYHTPSLVQHIGTASARWGLTPGPRLFAQAVDSVEEIPRWKPPTPRFGRIGLVGWNTLNGLGYLVRDIESHLPIDRWLAPIHPYFVPLPRPRTRCRFDLVASGIAGQKLEAWLDGLDWILFAETPPIERLPRAAWARDVNVACIPNWEWTSPTSQWLEYVDLMVCPTRHTWLLMNDWKRRYGFGWECVYVPWPVPTERFRFCLRRRCRRFLFVNGWGGPHARRRSGAATEYTRKGIELVAEAAWRAGHLPITVISQASDIPQMPANVEVLRPPKSNRALYSRGDVCVQPTHWEGIGLQLLECQAAGMPLVTTDAPPMNEYQPLAAIPASDMEIVYLTDQPIMSPRMEPRDLVHVLESLYETDIEEASRRARQYIEREHSWQRAREILKQRLVPLAISPLPA